MSLTQEGFEVVVLSPLRHLLFRGFELKKIIVNFAISNL